MGLTAGRAMANELDSARFDPLLVKSVAKNVAKATDAYVARIDGLVCFLMSGRHNRLTCIYRSQRTTRRHLCSDQSADHLNLSMQSSSTPSTISGNRCIVPWLLTSQHRRVYPIYYRPASARFARHSSALLLLCLAQLEENSQTS